MATVREADSTCEGDDKRTSPSNREGTIFMVMLQDALPAPSAALAGRPRPLAASPFRRLARYFGLQIFGSIVNPGAAPYRQAIPFFSKLVNVSDQSPFPLHWG